MFDRLLQNSQSKSRVVFIFIYLFIYLFFFVMQENLNVETLHKQYTIVKEETNTSHVQQYGDKVSNDVHVFCSAIVLLVIDRKVS